MSLEGNVALSHIVMMGGGLPQVDPPSAGMRYVRDVARVHRRWGQVVAVAPSDPLGKVLEDVRGVVPPRREHPAGSILDRAELPGRVEHAIRCLDPAAPPMHWLPWLLDGEGRRLIEQADVIDLEWLEFIRLAPILKRMNPHARVVGTFHDVMSQLFSRRADETSTSAARLRWKAITAWTRMQERAVLRHLDAVVTLNEKDSDLLRELGAADVEVICPPLGINETAREPEGHEVLVVGYYRRDVNVEGAQWLVEQVWPAVRAAVPDATLTLAGGDPDDRVSALASSENGISVTGWVDDLDPLYARAAVVVVPLLMGSGVKFKTIEAMCAGVPVVSTTIGAEGVHRFQDFGLVADDPDDFVNALIETLTDGDRSEKRAAEGRVISLDHYSWDSFECKVASVFHPQRFPE